MGPGDERDRAHAYPMNVEADNRDLEPENDEAWLEQAEAETEIEADWEREAD